MGTRRDSNVELLRIIMAFGVIVLHINGQEWNILQKATSFNLQSIGIGLLEVIFSVSVNVFLLIFGYYQVDKNKIEIAKVINMLMHVIYYNILFYFVCIFVGIESFSFYNLIIKCIPFNYYVIIYIAVYLLSPYVNIVITQLSSDELNKLVITVFFICSIEPFSVDILEKIGNHEAYGLSFVSMYGDDGGYTLVNFILMYILGAAVRKKEELRDRWSINIGGIYIFSTVFLVIGFMYSLFKNSLPFLLNYNNPILIISSICVLCLFKNINMKCSMAINKIAKATFTIYLVHNYILKILFVLLSDLKEIQISAIGIIIIGAFVTFVLSYIVYIVFEKPFSVIYSFVNTFIYKWLNMKWTNRDR